MQPDAGAQRPVDRRRSCLRVVGLLLLSIGLSACAGRKEFVKEYLTDPEDGKLDGSRYLSEVPMGFLPVPTVITEPAVGYGLGIGAVFFHETAAQREQRTEAGVLLPENISLLGLMGTENGTWGAGLGHFGFWRQDSFRYKGFLAYGSPNLDFYSLPGIGDLPRPVELNLEGPFVFQQLTYRLPGSHFFVGARQMYRHVEGSFAGSVDLPSLPPAVIDYFNQHLETEVTTSGIGGIVEYDTRDNPMNPQKGYHYSANYMIFRDAIGSDIDYNSFQVSLLNYWNLSDKFNLNFRFELDGVSSDDDTNLPAYVPPFVNLRGVSKSRYQGNSVAVAEVQLDYNIDPRWRVSVFTGIGRAADDFGDISRADDVNSYGTGFRYLIARRYGMMMGIDIARGPDETAFYIQAGSVW